MSGNGGNQMGRGNVIKVGEMLEARQWLTSGDGYFFVVLQRDGNFAEYPGSSPENNPRYVTKECLWNSKEGKKKDDAYTLRLTSGGAIEIRYSDGKLSWSSKNEKSGWIKNAKPIEGGSYYLTLENDGRLAMYSYKSAEPGDLPLGEVLCWESKESKPQWEFHIRNMASHKNAVTVVIKHSGGKVEGWRHNISYNPDGGNDPAAGGTDTNSVYAPSQFYASWGAWMPVWKDGVKLLKDLGVFIGSEGTDVKAAIKTIVDVMKVSVDVAREMIRESSVNVEELMNKSLESLDDNIRKSGIDPAVIRSFAEKHIVRCKGDRWSFFCGESYEKYIVDSKSSLCPKGWLVALLDKECADPTNWNVAVGAYLYRGALYYVYSDDMRKLWVKDVEVFVEPISG